MPQPQAKPGQTKEWFEPSSVWKTWGWGFKGGGDQTLPLRMQTSWGERGAPSPQRWGPASLSLPQQEAQVSGLRSLPNPSLQFLLLFHTVTLPHL